MKKKLGLIFLLITLTAIIYFIQNYSNSSKDDWTTFSKDQKGIEIHPTTQQEKKKVSIPFPNPKREISSVNKTPPLKRKTIGLPKGKKIEDLNLEFRNRINRDWKKILGEKLLYDLQDETQVFIKKIDSLLEIKGNEATYLEIAIVKFYDSKGNQSSFRALVDTESGKIMRRWDKTIFENYKSEKKGLLPSGTLKSN